MSAVDDVKAKITGIQNDVTEIHGDLQEVIAKLPADGGLTAAEVAEISAMLDALKVKTGEVAGIVPEPAPEPEPEA